jgi:hypothetical protein
MKGGMGTEFELTSVDMLIRVWITGALLIRVWITGAS